MSTRPTSSSHLQLELLETRMLLTADIPWLDDAVLTVGADFTADLETRTENGRDVTVLVLQGDATPNSSISIDTSLFGVTVDKIRISEFDHVTIGGSAALQSAVAWNIGELVVETKVTASLWVADVETITFKAPLPPKVSIYQGADVTLKAPSFSETELWGGAEKLTLISGKPTDSLDYWLIGHLDNKKVFLSFVPEKITISLSSTQLELVQQLFQVGDGEGPKFEVPSEWVRVLPLDEYQAHVADLFASIDMQIWSESLLQQAAGIPAALIDKAATTLMAAAEPGVLSASPEAIEVPVIAEVVAAPQSADLVSDFVIVPDHATAPAATAASDFVLHLEAKDPTPIARVAPMVGTFAANVGGMMPAASSLLEPLRGLRAAIVQRFTQEFVPGVRAALLVEPRAAKTAEDKKTAEA